MNLGSVLSRKLEWRFHACVIVLLLWMWISIWSCRGRFERCRFQTLGACEPITEIESDVVSLVHEISRTGACKEYIGWD